MAVNQKGADEQAEIQYVCTITWPEVCFGWNSSLAVWTLDVHERKGNETTRATMKQNRDAIFTIFSILLSLHSRDLRVLLSMHSLPEDLVLL
jgi:hypothetical protein